MRARASTAAAGGGPGEVCAGPRQAHSAPGGWTSPCTRWGAGRRQKEKEARAMSPPRENATAARTARVRHRLKERVLGRFRVEEIRINFRTTG